MRALLRSARDGATFLPRRLTARARLEPDFLVIGAQKAGTSSLYFYLIEHPGVAPSRREEVHFFDNNYTRGMLWYRAHFSLRRSARRAHGAGVITGESTPYYMFHPAGAERIAGALPEAKLIVLLRNPIDRAWSHYHHELANRNESLGFDEACEREQTRLDGEVERLLREPGYQSFAYQRSSYLARGRYAEQLEAWLARVPAEQLLILSAEDFLRDTAGLFREVTRFLGLPDHELAHYERHNAQRYPAMSPVTREALGAYFRPHNQRLYALLGRDFGWDA